MFRLIKKIFYHFKYRSEEYDSIKASNDRYLPLFIKSAVIIDTCFLRHPGFKFFSQTFLTFRYRGKFHTPAKVFKELNDHKYEDGSPYARAWLDANADRLIRFDKVTATNADVSIVKHVLDKMANRDILVLTQDRRLATASYMQKETGIVFTNKKIRVLRLIDSRLGQLGPNDGVDQDKSKK